MKQLLPLLTATLLLGACGGNERPATTPEPEPAAVNVYSHRHYDTDKALFERFTQETGIPVNLVMADDDEVLARLEQEGASSPCDLLITSDAGRLGLAAERGLLQPSGDAGLDALVPAHLRDGQGRWYALTMRARVVAYHKDKVDPATIATYDDLTRPDWKGRLLVRSSANIYNQSLVSALVAHEGREKALAWCQGIVANMAREPKGGDTDQMLALAEGQGDVAIVNSYYAGKLLTSDEPEKQAAAQVIGIVFPSLGTHGTHVNVSGAGLAAHAPHKPEALKLLHFLLGTEAQAAFAEGNKEYPVRAAVPVAPVLQGFGELVPDSLPLEELARNNATAVMVMEEAGWR